MRANMDPLNPMASTLDPAIAHIYSQASSIRQALRDVIPRPDDADHGTEAVAAAARRKRTRELAVEALGAPERIRQLVEAGRKDEARRQWEMPRRLLERWTDLGLGGDDVAACIEEGDAVLGGRSGEEDPDTPGS